MALFLFLLKICAILASMSVSFASRLLSPDKSRNVDTCSLFSQDCNLGDHHSWFSLMNVDWCVFGTLWNDGYARGLTEGTFQ